MATLKREIGFFCIAYCCLPCFALLAQDEQASRSEYCSGSRCLGRRFRWKGVYDILVKDGYNISIVQEPETSFQEDVVLPSASLLFKMDPAFFVAHSYGGAVITEAGRIRRLSVLVYIAAHMPDAGRE